MNVAPGAGQAFHTALEGQASFAQGIIDLANAGAKVITDDVFYFAEPFYQDGIVAQAVNTVKGMGVSCKSKLVMSGSGKLEVSALIGSGGVAGGPDRDERERDQAVGGIESVGGWGVEPA